MSVFFRQIQHLLPRSKTWALAVDRTLRRFFVGLAETPTDAREFIDQVHEDVFPSTTRELVAWEQQHGIYPDALASDAERIALLDAEWSAQGGQSLEYIQETLQTAGFDVYLHSWWKSPGRAAGELGGAFYLDRTLAVQSVSGTISRGMCFGDNGSKLYTIGATTDVVAEWDLSTPYRIDNATDSGNSIDITANMGNPYSLQFKPDGLSFFVLDAGIHGLREWTLTTAWDVSSASYSGNATFPSWNSEDGDPSAVYFRPDGLAVYMVGFATEAVFKYNLTTAWDITTAAYSGVSFDVGTETGNTGASGLEFLPNGRRFLVAQSGVIYQFELSTPWDITTAVYSGDSFDPAESATNVQDIRLGGIGGESAVGYVSGSKLFTIDATDDVYEYSLSSFEAHDPHDYLTNPLLGTTQCGEALAQCGEVDAVCGTTTINEPDYIVNLDRTVRAPPFLPTDPEFYPYFFYVGGETFGDTANISERRRQEFERLLLKLRPLNQWIGLFVEYVAELAAEDGDLLTTEGGDVLSLE